MSDNEWQTPGYRQNVVDKINDALQASGMTSSRNGQDMENSMFQKARSREDYVAYIAKLIIHIRDSGKKPQNAETAVPNPIDALTNLSQGSRNTMQSQMMTMGGPGGNNQNTNVLQNLIHQRPGPQQMPNMPNMGGGGRPVPGPHPGMAGNIQQGNIPPGGIVGNNMNMGMGGMGQQIPNPGNQMNPMGNQMQMNAMGVQGQQMGQMNNMVQMNMNAGMQQNPMNVGMNAQINPNQMNPQMMARMNPGAMNASMNPAMNAGINPNQINSGQMLNQLSGNPGASGIPVQQQQMGGPNIMPNHNMTGMNQPNMAPNQMNAAGQMNMLNMGHMGRNQSPNVLYQVRNVAPNAPYFRKSPSPSAPSPNMAANLPNQMVPSPALTPSPQIPNVMPQQRNVMAPSPSSVSLNTPGQAAAAPSPLNPQEDQMYRDKYRQLTKYIEPLKRMVARIGNDGKTDEKFLKMNKLLEILCNPNQRIPLETLVKCEIALEKMDLKSYSMSTTGSQLGGLKEQQINNPLLEAVSANLQSPIGNHTLQRTFRPCLETLFGPDINLRHTLTRTLPQPVKQQKFTATDDAHPSNTQEIPHVLQGEIARLDQKFKISIDPSSQVGTKVIKLVCCLDDKHLPYVPPISVVIPEEYPYSSAKLYLSEQEYNTTLFLATIHQALMARICKVPKLYSLTHILDVWEMSVRQACSPTLVNNPCTLGALLGM